MKEAEKEERERKGKEEGKERGRKGGKERKEKKKECSWKGVILVLAVATVRVSLGFCCFSWRGCVSSLVRVIATPGVLTIS